MQEVFGFIILEFRITRIPDQTDQFEEARTAAGEDPYGDAWWPEGHLIGYEHTFVNMVADMMAVLAGEEPTVPLPNFADAYETQRVLEAALVSARERAAVKVAEVR